MTTLRAEGAYRRYVLRYYNRFANLYDLGEFMRHRTRRRAILLSGWQPGDHILDLCTGTGGLALAFASQGANVVGVDIARGMLKRAASKRHASTVTWLEMDATRLGFPNATFDVSMLSLALHHMPEDVQLNVLGELRRVTRRRIVLIEPEVPVQSSWFPAWAFVASVIDESEYMREWVRQDFIGTCQKAGLRVESVETSRSWIHRFIRCSPIA